AVDGTTVYFTTTAGRLYAVDGTRRGLPLEHRLRRLILRMRLIGLPAPRLGDQTGQLWALDVGKSSTSSPLVFGDSLYVGADDDLVAVDLVTREVLWRFRTPGPVSSSPRLAGDLVLVGSEDGSVYAVQATTGELQWQIRTAGKVTSSAAFALGTAFIGSHDGTLYAIE
ncbi:MAG: PQQ-binding-like beta-propeller repeat protein, partial [Rhodococcus sp.]|nr:PQQ-binding-like beta-propeller repeat protein [Rhodococcus sp. (in: high G+C Gram-positive bacteria)]